MVDLLLDPVARNLPRKTIRKMFILGISIVFLEKCSSRELGAILISKERISTPQGRPKNLTSKRSCQDIVITKNGLRHLTQSGYPLESSLQVGLTGSLR